MKLKWVVEFSVDETWIMDGFELTKDRALDILSNDLKYANITELGARILKSPDKKIIRKLRGY
jgi:hypothetical protein